MEKKKKNKAGRWIAWLCLVCVVAGLAALPMLSSRQEDSADKPIIKKASAEYRTLTTQIIGGGQLEGDGLYNVNIPDNVLLERYLVGNGDLVRKGDPVAQVDKVSVLSAIQSVQTTLDELSSQILDASNSGTTGNIDTAVAGRVKKIYAQPGDSVEDVILAHGALAVISLDDMMAATFPCATRTELGDRVELRFEDGTMVIGRVRSNISGEVTVLVEDHHYAIGTPVTVLSMDGEPLGSAELYVYNAWNLIGYNGTVSYCYVSEESMVYANQTIFSVTGLSLSARYRQLVDLRQKYEARMFELFQMYRSGVVTAPCDGIVSGVDRNGAYMLASREGETDGIQLLLLSAVEPKRELRILTESLPDGKVGVTYTAWLLADDGVDELSTEGEWSVLGLPGDLTLDSASGELSGTPKAAGTFSITVGFTCNGQTVTKDLTLTVGKSDQPTYYGYLAQVTVAGGDTIRVNRTEYAFTISDPERLPSASPNADEMTVTDQIYSGETVAKGGFSVGDFIWVVVDADGKPVKTARLGSSEPSDPTGENPGGGSGGTRPGGLTGGMSGGMFDGLFGGMFGGMSGGMSDGKPGGGTAEGPGKASVATITSQEHMNITVSIDELDITSLYVGQPATVTMNSLAGETARATVKSIANSGENSGGNTKFSVVFALEKSSDMLPGMTATVYITTDENDHALCVPAGAVYDLNGESVVYTGYDGKNSKLTNPVTVTIGSAEADYVEILSGLREGDNVYYEYYDNLRVEVFV